MRGIRETNNKTRTNLGFFKNKKFRCSVILVTGVFSKNKRSTEQTTIHSSLDGTLIEKRGYGGLALILGMI